MRTLMDGEVQSLAFICPWEGTPLGSPFTLAECCQTSPPLLSSLEWRLNKLGLHLSASAQLYLLIGIFGSILVLSVLQPISFLGSSTWDIIWCLLKVDSLEGGRMPCTVLLPV